MSELEAASAGFDCSLVVGFTGVIIKTEECARESWDPPTYAYTVLPCGWSRESTVTADFHDFDPANARELRDMLYKKVQVTGTLSGNRVDNTLSWTTFGALEDPVPTDNLTSGVWWKFTGRVGGVLLPITMSR